MSSRLRFSGLAAAVCLMMPGVAALAAVPLPQVPKAQDGATQCVEDTAVMRRQHYDFMLHQRDDTVHKGIRSSRHSLKECISCHVQPRIDGSIPRHDDADHFCRACHNYAAVKVDCFECHADRDTSGEGK